MPSARYLKEDPVLALELDLLVVDLPRHVHDAVHAQNRFAIEPVILFNLWLDGHQEPPVVYSPTSPMLPDWVDTRQYTLLSRRRPLYKARPDTSGPGRCARGNCGSGR